MTGGSGDHGVAERRKQRAGVERAQGLFGIEAERNGSRHGGWVGDGAGTVGVAINAVGAGAQYGEHVPGVMSEFKRTGQSELLITTAGAGRAIERDCHLTSGDEAETTVQRAQIVESIEQISCGIRVVPVVAGVVDRDKVTGHLREGPRAFDQIVARQQYFENGVAKSLVFVGEVDGRGEAAGLSCIATLKPGKKRRPPALVAWRFWKIVSFEEGADRGRELCVESVLVDDLANLIDCGVIGRGWTGRERIERPQGHIGQQK